MTFYGVAWKNTTATLQFSVAGTVIGTQTLAGNAGATGNAPYTITVADSDFYTFQLPYTLDADTEVTVKTVDNGYRAIVFGVNAQ